LFGRLPRAFGLPQEAQDRLEELNKTGPAYCDRGNYNSEHTEMTLFDPSYAHCGHLQVAFEVFIRNRGEPLPAFSLFIGNMGFALGLLVRSLVLLSGKIGWFSN
jgi:hypothetical protein